MELQEAIDHFIRDNWEQVIADIDALVRIPSVEDLAAAAPGAPFGPEPAHALACALGIAQRMGLVTENCDGYMGYADLPGLSATQVGIIGHVDVVPEGPGWTYPAYCVTHKDGFLVGRGVADDKGPLVVALYAVDFWKRQLDAEGKRFPYTVRVLFGANEETGMEDVAYYRGRYPDPAFLFTPDAEFPVAYGEAGICSGVLESALLADSAILRMEGGAAVNAVPGKAVAELALESAAAARLVAAVQSDKRVICKDVAGGICVTAQGKSAHASTPELGENAIGILTGVLLQTDVLSGQEQTFLDLVHQVASCTDGSGVGVQVQDADFGALTAVGSLLSCVREGSAMRLRLAIDFRYPANITAEEIEHRMGKAAACAGATFVLDHDKQPFLMDADSPAVQALMDAYNHVTGEDARPFTMKGGTYARLFPRAASFGPEKPWEEKPSWAGAMHAADEAISEDLLKQALVIYIYAIGNLMGVDPAAYAD